MWEELGISAGTGIIVLIALYFIIKWAVKNGIEEAYKNITGKDTAEEQEFKTYAENIQKGYEKSIEEKARNNSKK